MQVELALSSLDRHKATIDIPNYSIKIASNLLSTPLTSLFIESIDESEEWTSQLISNLSNWKEEAWKNQGFNGIRTRDLRDTGAMLYQLSHEATHAQLQWSFFTFIYIRSSNMNYFIYNSRWINWIRYCPGCLQDLQS